MSSSGAASHLLGSAPGEAGHSHGTAAAISGGGGGGGRRSGAPSLLSSVWGWLKGQLAWLTFQGIGLVLAAPMGLKLIAQFILRPLKTVRRVDRSQLQLPDPLPGLIHEWIETEPGIKLHAVRTSKGSGRPLMLLVHGFPEAWFSWRHQMREFREQYEVVAIDMRGYNESSKPKGRAAYRMDHLVADVRGVAEHLLQETGQEQLVLVGHDWGANICWMTAHTAPHLLSRLVILCVPHPRCYFANMDWNQFRRSWYVFAFQPPLLPEACICAGDYAMLEDALTKHPPGWKGTSFITKEELERYKQAFGRPGAPTALINYYRAMIDASSRSPLPLEMSRAQKRKLTVPTLLLWAEFDVALGQQLLRGTDRYVESVRIEVLKGCSHWAQQDQPEQVNRLMREFLAGSGGKAAKSR